MFLILYSYSITGCWKSMFQGVYVWRGSPMNIDDCPYLLVSYRISCHFAVCIYSVGVRGPPPNGWCPYLSLACAGFPGQGRVRLWECMCALAEGWDDGTGTFDWCVIVQPDSARLNWWGHGLREEVLFVLFTFSCPSVWRLAILSFSYSFFLTFFLSVDHLHFPPLIRCFLCPASRDSACRIFFFFFLTWIIFCSRMLITAIHQKCPLSRNFFDKVLSSQSLLLWFRP